MPAFLPNAVRRFRNNAACLGLLIVLTGVVALPAQDDLLNGFKNPLEIKFPGQESLTSNAVPVTVSVEPQSAKPGDVVTLNITIDVPPDSYTYSMNREFGGATQVKLTTITGLEPVGDFAPDHKPEAVFVPEFDQTVEKFKSKVTFSQQFRVVPGATTGQLTGTMKYQVCDESSCRNLKAPIDVAVTISNSPGGAVQPAATGRGQPGPQAIPARTNAPAPTSDLFTITPTLRNKNVQTTVRLTPPDAQAGDTVTLQFHVTLADGWHTFSTSQPEDNAAEPTEFEVDEDNQSGYEWIDPEFVADRPFEIKQIPQKNENPPKVLIQEQFEHEVTWSRKLRLLPGTALSDIRLSGKVRFQTCNQTCIPNSVKFAFPASTGQVGAVVPTRGSDSTPPTAAGGAGGGPNAGGGPQPEVAEPPLVLGGGIQDLSAQDCVASSSETNIRNQGVVYVLGAAFAAGLLALLTPCVFPMVPITVSFFLKQSEKKNNSPLKMALVYCFSIIGTFTVLGLAFSALFGATFINSLANGVLINLLLGIVLLFFALNLLGLFDIQIPSWLLTFTSSKESTGSYLGVFFMALTFTLTSFTCTFAFLGLILVWAAKGEFWWALGAMIAFSTAFALPFFLLALFPSYLHRLPKSGGWMNRVKVVMGLIEMAFMFKFLSVADIAWNSTPTIFDYHLVMSAWLAIAVIAGMYLLGKIQLPHDTKEDHIGVLPMVCAMGFLGLAGYLAAGIFSHEPPSGFLGRQITAFAPPRFNGGVGADGAYLVGKHDEQTYLLEFEKAKAKARRENLPLFVDFTGVNCINCREMEVLMAESGIKSKLGQFVRVQLYCDKLPKEAVGDLKRGEELVEQNTALQEGWYGDVTLPSYAILSPDGESILSKLRGKNSAGTFETFLECGMNKWKKANSGTVSTASR